MPPFNASSWLGLIDPWGAPYAQSAPAADDQLAHVERCLRLALPAKLQELLHESNGIRDGDGSGLIWSAAEIARANLAFRETEGFRELYMPFDHLLFFGDDGGGNQFAFAIQADGLIRNPDVYRWDHETDAREWYAGTLKRYLEQRSREEQE